MSSTPKEPSPPVADDTPIGDIEDMVPERLAPLGDFDEDDDEESPMELDLGAFIDAEPLVGLLEPTKETTAGKPVAATHTDEPELALPDAAAREDEELPTMDDWGFDDDKKEDSPADEGEGPDRDEALDLEAQLAFPDSAEQADEEAIEELSHEEVERLSMELYEEEEADPEGRPSVDATSAFLLDSTFLGPVEGRGCAAAFPGGKPIVVGEGMFVLAADGLLHETAGSARLAVAEAGSVLVHGRSVFVGTEHGGLFVTRDMGQTFETLNNWVGQGLVATEGSGLRTVPSSFQILGQTCSMGMRFFGLTGEGELLSTFAPEQGWQGPFGLGRCLAVCPVHGTDEALLVSVSADGSARLVATKDFDRLEPRELPPGVRSRTDEGSLLLAASGSTVLCGLDALGLCAFVSDDAGLTWRPLSQLGRPTSVLVDPDDPSFLAVASWRQAHGMGALHVSEDLGVSFRTVLVTGERQSWEGQGSQEHRIRNLSLHLGRTRRLLAVTDAGTFMIALAKAESTH